MSNPETLPSDTPDPIACQQTEQGQCPLAGPPLCILLVEDHPVNEELALRMLSRLGYSADVARNGFEALAAVAERPYDVVLMDIQMPELDGLEACRRIRAMLPAEHQPRIIAMTANALAGDRQLCLEAGMDAYLSKPVRSDDLRGALFGEAAQSPPPFVSVSAPVVFAPEALVRLAENLGVAAPMMLPTLLRAFFEESSLLVAALVAHTAEGDFVTVRRLAHTLKSHGATFGGRAFEQSCRELEAVARVGDREQVAHYLPRVQVEYALLCAALKAALPEAA